MKKRMRQASVLLTLFVSLLLVAAPSGCKKSGTDSSGGTSQTKATPTPRNQFERDLNYVRDGQFLHIYVFARKDNAKFESEDITYLKANSPSETNMWVMTDEGKKVIAGSNFDFKPEHFNALNQRFIIEDYTGR